MRNPKNENYYFPAEWHPHEATWLSFPINTDTWEDRFERIYPAYFKFIETISFSEKVRINANNKNTIDLINRLLDKFEINQSDIELFEHPTNDSWCRDHGPGFLINKNNNGRLIVDWEYNAWGGKYPPYNNDNDIPQKIAKVLGLDFVSPGIIMEGGSVEFNGNGSLMTSKSCLLNPNRNPHLKPSQIEEILSQYYGVEQILWIEDGIVGDDTDGHIDDTVRFVSENKVITMVESNKSDENHAILDENLKLLKGMRVVNGKQLDIVEIEMPKAVIDNGERLPASYANFCITNGHVIVPTYRCNNDDKALDVIQSCFPDRKVVGIDSTEIIWGLGSFHCLSQQEPSPNFA
jgi:agmatine deiminase